MHTKPIQETHDVGGETDADRHVANSVFQDEVPADYPGDEFAHGGIGIGVGAAGDGDHGRELGITDGSEAADDGDQDEGERDRWSRTGAAEGGGAVDQVFEQGSVQNRGDLQLLAGDGGTNDGENPGTDHGSNTEGRQTEPAQGFFELNFGIFGVR